jgi:5-methylcytosine-specific restriction protein A
MPTPQVLLIAVAAAGLWWTTFLTPWTTLLNAGLLKPCTNQPCSNFGDGGPCAEHRRKYEQHRGSARARGYDGTWDRLRPVVLAEEPICGECQAEGFIVPSTEVDHIIPIAQRPELRLVRSNLQGLCKAHHSRKTVAELRGWPLSTYQQLIARVGGSNL